MFVSAEEITSNLQNFEEWLDKSNHSMNTTASYLSDAKGFGDWFVSQNENEMSLEEAALKFLSYERSYRRLSKATIQRKKSSVNSFIYFLSEGGTHSSFLHKKFLITQEQKTLVTKLDALVEEALIQYPSRWLTTLRDVSLVKFLLNSNMKLSEVREMEIDDLHHMEQETENRKISAEGFSVARTWLAYRPDTYKNPFIWIALEHQHKGPLSIRSLYRVVSETGKRVSINISPQILRDSFVHLKEERVNEVH